MAELEWNELTKEEKEEILAKVVAKEIAETHAQGLPTTHGSRSCLYRRYPDGSKVYIEDEKKEKTV